MAAPEAEVVSAQQLTAPDQYQFSGDNPTVERKRAFIAALRSEGTIYHAALTARIHRSTYYDWMERDPAFVTAVEDSREDCYDQAETSVFRKALAGDSLLLMFYLKAHRPKFRDKVTIDIEAVNEEIRERMKQLGTSQPLANPLHFLPSSPDQQKEQRTAQPSSPTTATTTDNDT